MVRLQFTDSLPLKSQVFEHWKERLPGLGFFIDWGEPGCWACGFHYGAKYDIKRSHAPWHEVLLCWGKIPLQRCHITPRSLGGTDDVANLFLMCHECHDQMPNTSIPEIFFEWARAQNWDTRESAKICAALDAFSIDSAKREDLNELIISKEFKSWISAKFGLHRPQSNYAPRSSRLTPATIVGLAVYYQRSKSSPLRASYRP
jgi:HNH endonuclease